MNLSIHTAPDVRPLPWHRTQWAKRWGFARRNRSNQSRAPWSDDAFLNSTGYVPNSARTTLACLRSIVSTSHDPQALPTGWCADAKRRSAQPPPLVSDSRVFSSWQKWKRPTNELPPLSATASDAWQHPAQTRKRHISHQPLGSALSCLPCCLGEEGIH